ncbi:protein-tyrosine phosphatase family protein [Calothrix sp. NIES-2098]|uniref:protein-tyrosine phosphatase family protein n=1 Tax=Calothrix sp. NIES-2098 TaxID=1954171 RepID=UPI000B5FC649|nr:dual specificity protein phosphatase [Calothrix sp. NIES-2098]
MYKFAPAGENESIVYGAARPGYLTEKVHDWIDFMKQHDIKRVCCLLEEKQLIKYSANLLQIYEREFGNLQVCWAPIEDFHLCDLKTLTTQILPFLIAADKQNEKVVVHCAGGIGRTGHVLAAWLVSVRGLSNQSAIRVVKNTGRNPYEAVLASVFIGRNPFKVMKELDLLLNNCRIAIRTDEFT